jgi:hypothetical protein
LSRARRRVAEMSYVVKATSPDGVADWICQTKFAHHSSNRSHSRTRCINDVEHRLRTKKFGIVFWMSLIGWASERADFQRQVSQPRDLAGFFFAPSRRAPISPHTNLIQPR